MLTENEIIFFKIRWIKQIIAIKQNKPIST